MGGVVWLFCHFFSFYTTCLPFYLDSSTCVTERSVKSTFIPAADIFSVGKCDVKTSSSGAFILWICLLTSLEETVRLGRSSWGLSLKIYPTKPWIIPHPRIPTSSITASVWHMFTVTFWLIASLLMTHWVKTDMIQCTCCTAETERKVLCSIHTGYVWRVEEYVGFWAHF